MSSSTKRVPSTRRLFVRGLTKACSFCGQRGLFNQWVKMVELCPKCGLKFERIEGHWVGAIGINTVVSFAALLISLVAGLVATFPDFPAATLTAINLGVMLITPILFYPFSKTIWTSIDIMMRPLEPHEVNWNKSN